MNSTDSTTPTTDVADVDAMLKGATPKATRKATGTTPRDAKGRILPKPRALRAVKDGEKAAPKAPKAAAKPKAAPKPKPAPKAAARKPARTPKRATLKPGERVSVEAFRTKYSASDTAVDQFVDLDTAIARAVSDVASEVRAHYVAFVVGTRTIASVVPQSKRLRVILPLDPATHTAPHARDLASVGHWGVGNLEVIVDTDTDLGQVVRWIGEAARVPGA